MMKKIAYVLVVLMATINAGAQAEWDFGELSSIDLGELDKDADSWYYDSSKSRYSYQKELKEEQLTASGKAIGLTEGLYLTAPAIGASKTAADGVVRLDVKNSCLNLNGSVTIKIKNLTAGHVVAIAAKSSSSSTARTLEIVGNITNTANFGMTSTDKQTYTGTVTTDGDISFRSTGGTYLYSIVVSNPNETPSSDKTSNAVSLDLTKNQANIQQTNGDVKYYNTESLESIDIDGATVTVRPKGTESNDVFNGTVSKISFKKATVETGLEGKVTNAEGKVEITESKGWLESAYVKWAPFANATSYAVYVKGGQYSDYTQLDTMLVRDYGTYGRADAVGLKAGSDYAFKVVPIINGAESEANGNEATEILVKNYDRGGFAHLNYSGVGAYADDGQLKSGAKVLYVTSATAKTITTNVITNKNGSTTSCTGLQTILDAYQKNLDTTPIAFRIIGTVSKDDLDHISSSAEGIQVKGKDNTIPMNITIEGIGEDATVNGFGFLIRSALGIEFRNLGIINFMDDGLSFDTDNAHCWVHNIDIFYGNAGGDSDQAKGDGSIDVKGDSRYMTFSAVHFWDSGKCSLCGMTSESGPNYITYRGNWFDHSDSRHPRIRTMSVHVYNNYFDGNAKYGVGSTTGSDVFVENNYFRNCKYPMLTSLQGSDMSGGKGTFSGEAGGSIKSYGNLFTGSYTYKPYSPNNTVEFDAYEATSRNEQVPASVVSKSGNNTYSNFDTDNKAMYDYTPLAAEEVPSAVTGWYGAGRMNHGDLKYTFDNEKEDRNYAIISALKTAVTNYKGTVKGIFGKTQSTSIANSTSAGSGETGGGSTGGGSGDSGTTISGSVNCTFSVSTKSASNTLFSVTGNYSNSKGTATVNGTTLTDCLKMESSTSVKFSLEKPMTLTLVFASTETGKKVKVDGTAYTTDSSGIVTVSLDAGSHEITKGDSINLFYIALSE